ncbi:MAG: PD-(D/E)XK nuclease family protein [Clostridiales bacterium]|nr:PD-(D/E)XK nuclease family protein [Clostridiales bacterium]
MITIYKTNTMADASRYITDVISRVDTRNLDVMHTVIVPDRASLEAERALLSAVGGSFNAQVKTFRRLAADILPKYDYLSKQAGIMALSAIIKDHKDELTCYVKGVDTPGFVENMYDTISMMKYCKITPRQLMCDLPKSVKGKAQDIALLYQAYLEYTSNRFIDSADKLDLLCDQIANTDIAAKGYFYLYDFDNFSTQELAIVEQLMLKSRGVYVACCVGDGKRDKHLYLDDIYQGVLALCKRNGIEPQIISGKNFKNRYAEQIGKHLYRYDECCAIDATGYASIYEGTTRVNEVYALACEVQKYVRNGGRFRDVYVVTSDVAKYQSAISTIFDQFEIPYFCDRQFALSDHPYARYVIDYLTLHKNNGKLNSVLPFVKNYLFCADFSGDLSQNDDVFLFENYCLKYNVSYRYDSFSLGKEETYFEQADAFRRRFNELYTQVKIPESATVATYVEIIRRLIEVSNLAERNRLFAEQQVNVGLSFEAKVTSQVQEKFEGVLTQAQQVLGERHVELGEFIKTLTAGVASVKVSVIPVYSDCVIFANMAKARKHDIKFLALLGANYGAMPIVKSDSKLLSDRNIVDLVNAGVNVEPQIFTENRRERFSLFQLLLEPTHKLYVSYTLTDGADSLMPSPFVNELGVLFFANGQALEPTLQTDEDIYTERQAIAKVILNNRRLCDSQMVHVPSFNALSQLFADSIARYAFAKDGKAVSVDRGAELYLKNSATSVSQLTDFFKCPYRFYIQYGLNVKPRSVAELNSAELGNVLHAVLEEYVRDMDVTESDEETALKAEKWFDYAMRDDFYKGLRNDPKMVGVLEQLKAESCRMCKVVKQQLSSSNFKNLATELAFGGGNELLPVVVEFTDGKFALVGKIDRVDVKDGRFIVIDYKSGSAAASYHEKDLYIGHKMQLPVYVRAVEQIYGMRPAGFYYFNMHDNFTDLNAEKVYTYNGRTLDDVDVAKDIDTNLASGKSEKLGLKLKSDGTLSHVGNRLLSDAQFDSQTEYAFQLIKRAGELMKQGYAAVSPYKGACDYCDYKDICDFGDVYTYNAREVKDRVTKETIDKVDKGENNTNE